MMIALVARYARVGAILAAMGSSALAQDHRCQISPIRGASSPAGADATMRVVNDGRSCGVTVYGLPAERKNPAFSGSITLAPRNGTAELSASRASYSPSRGFSGEDAFAFEAMVNDSRGRPVRLQVRIKVTVLPAP